MPSPVPSTVSFPPCITGLSIVMTVASASSPKMAGHVKVGGPHLWKDELVQRHFSTRGRLKGQRTGGPVRKAREPPAPFLVSDRPHRHRDVMIAGIAADQTMSTIAGYRADAASPS
jgi:hypothetical protein